MQGLSKTSRNAVIATLVISLVLLFGSMTAPLLGYIGKAYAADGVNIFLIVQVPAFVAMIVSFSTGFLAMKINLKYLMAACAVSALAYFLIFALVGSSNFTMLLVAAGIVGICQGMAMVLTSSIFGIYVFDDAQRANFVAISGALMNGGGAVVNVVGGMLAAGSDGLGANWNSAYWLGLLIVPALIVFWILMPKAPDAPEGAADGPGGPGGPEGAPAGPPPDSGFIPVKVFLIIALGLFVSLGMAAFLLNVGVYITTELFVPLEGLQDQFAGLTPGTPEYMELFVSYTDPLSPTYNGYEASVATGTNSGLANSLFTILGVVAGFAFPIVSRFLKNFIAPIGYALGACGLACLVFMNSTIMGIFLGACLMGLGFNIAMPFVMGKILAITPPRWIPIAMSINMGVMNLVFTFVPNILGALSAPMGGTIQSQLLIGTIIVAVMVVVSVFLLVIMPDPKPAGMPAPAEE